MASTQDCIEFANQCVRLADLCEDDPQLREHPSGAASEWMAIAAQETVDVWRCAMTDIPPPPSGIIVFLSILVGAFFIAYDFAAW